MLNKGVNPINHASRFADKRQQNRCASKIAMSACTARNLLVDVASTQHHRQEFSA
jgi:hypothetical protein